ncbi:MAG: hypothetical protein IPM77_03370 [Crocinitomicaceae bacterium]|nr:hypothetical protein [Crocinitomicaceae bacterium]
MKFITLLDPSRKRPGLTTATKIKPAIIGSTYFRYLLFSLRSIAVENGTTDNFIERCSILAFTSSRFNKPEELRSLSSCNVFLNLSPISGKKPPIFSAASQTVMFFPSLLSFKTGTKRYLINKKPFTATNETNRTKRVREPNRPKYSSAETVKYVSNKTPTKRINPFIISFL